MGTKIETEGKKEVKSAEDTYALKEVITQTGMAITNVKTGEQYSEAQLLVILANKIDRMSEVII